MTLRSALPGLARRFPARVATRAGLTVLVLVPLLLVAVTKSAPSELRSPIGLPDCSAAPAPALAAGYDQWADTLLDPSHGVGADYVPPDLQSQAAAGRRVTLRGFLFRPLEEMLAAASADGVLIAVNSGYRSYRQQARLERSMSEDRDLVARAGHSEHQLGTAVDLAGGHEWLERNSWRFGFLLSYQSGRSPWTCYPYEPWHFRYFGLERAEEIRATGLSPREWLWQRHLASAT